LKNFLITGGRGRGSRGNTRQEGDKKKKKRAAGPRWMVGVNIGTPQDPLSGSACFSLSDWRV